jgi:hypothetical protein
MVGRTCRAWAGRRQKAGTDCLELVREKAKLIASWTVARPSSTDVHTSTAAKHPTFSDHRFHCHREWAIDFPNLSRQTPWNSELAFHKTRSLTVRNDDIRTLESQCFERRLIVKSFTFIPQLQDPYKIWIFLELSYWNYDSYRGHEWYSEFSA